MKIKVNQSGRKGRAIVLGVGVAVAFMLAITAVLTMLIINDTLNIDTLPIVVPILHFVSTMLCGLTAGKYAGQKFVIIIGITVSIYCLLLLAMALLIFDGIIEGIGLCLFADVLGALVACLMCVTKPSKRRIKTHAL